MTRQSLVVAGLRYYRGVHAMVVIGVAVAVTVMAGALLVGSSVKASLRAIALARLGETRQVAASPTFFRQQLGPEVGATAIVALTGAVTHADSGRSAAQVQVFGVNQSFVQFHGLQQSAPQGREVWISEALAADIQARAGDALVLRVARPSDIPLDTLQGRRDQAGERLRVSVARIAERDALGDFALSPAQGPARTLFIALDRLQNALGLDNRANTLLFGERADDIGTALGEHATLEDYGLRLRPAPGAREVVVESHAGVMNATVVKAVEDAAAALHAPAETVLVHLANTMTVRGREVPYSIVAGRAMASRGIALNQWAADNLGAHIGDEVTLDFFVWSDSEGLREARTTLPLVEIVAMSSAGGDPTFTPDYPGLTNAADIASWDPPFPVDLKRIRKIDEDYWDRWRAAPKAFVPIEIAQRLWGTTHGTVSSVRVTAPASPPVADFSASLAAELRRHLSPDAAGFQIRDARQEALSAAEGTTDFGAYFFYFSFFLVVAGLLLAGLFFSLGVEQRTQEIGVLGALGFTGRDTARVLVSEAAILASLGSAIGAFGAVGYAALIMYGLRTWWIDAVGTTELTLHINWLLVAAGALAALVAATLALAVSLRSTLKRTPRALLGGPVGSLGERRGERRGPPWMAIALSAAALALMGAAAMAMLPAVAGFFGAGGLLMLAGLALFNWWLRSAARLPLTPSVMRFGSSYARWRPTRSVLSASLITLACFIIVSVGAFRRDAAGISLDRRAGTGGFALMAESIAPLLYNPNIETGRQELGLEPGPTFTHARVTRFRLSPGDEASCLTLYQPTRPRIIAPEAAFADDRRFTFAASLAETADERDNPWRLLARRFADGAIPAIADETSLTYVFHLKIGDDFVFTPESGTATRLRIVGTLADSVFQSELIIGEDAFVKLFPHRAGYHVWMIDVPANEAAALATFVEDRLADYGVDVIDTRARLQAYHRVENTYLSTFQALGGLGLVIGTLGIAAVLARNVLERRRELALLGAVGFTPHHLRTVILSESLILVGAGLALGSLAAVVAVLPAVRERAGAVPLTGLALLVIGVTVTAALSALAAARISTATPVVAALKSE